MSMPTRISSRSAGSRVAIQASSSRPWSTIRPIRTSRHPSIAFDPAQYLAANPDVAAAGVNPLRHYLQFGYQEGRVPFAPTELVAQNGFDFVYYLNHNPDVAA